MLRRKDLLQSLKMEKEKFAKVLSASTTHSSVHFDANSRSELLMSTSPSARQHGQRVIGVAVPETEITKDLDNHGLLQVNFPPLTHSPIVFL